MARMTEDEQLAALQKQKDDIKAAQLKINRKIRAVRTRKRTKADRSRVHVGIVVGLEMIEHAIRNPSSEVRRVAIRIMENHLTKRPDDFPVADMLALLKAPASAAADVPEAAE
jgi:hypothetical protein